ncbi:MAG TPA: prephenate dehydrogenase/arogenate dehydrogenase family protein [Methylomirabilota bacterium]|nr:prephenate dehydrogenase/arogenate dehydrogenase family protein [Methylomirabilota bacterium]
MIRRLCVVGPGLLGGSVALAARARGLAQEIVAVGRSDASVAPALRAGAVDRGVTDLGEGLRGSDLCILATPVATLENQLAAVWAAAEPDVVITDVGSTKGRIVERAERLAAGRPLAFVGSHPMAGSERAGFAEARADLFVGATVIVTPTARTAPAALARVRGLWEAMGARITVLDPLTHDRAAAAVSHLPHLVADALVDAVTRMDPAFFEVAARGFRDTTRIAASSPPIWREIFQDNRAALGEALAAFRKSLDHLENVLATGDAVAVEAELERIKKQRERVG